MNAPPTEQLAVAEAACNDQPLAQACLDRADLLEHPEHHGRIYVHALVHRIDTNSDAPVSEQTLRTMARLYRAMAIELDMLAAEKRADDLLREHDNK